MKKEKPKKRGGKRSGAGRPRLYDEETNPITFKVPDSKRNEFEEYCKEKLKTYEK